MKNGPILIIDDDEDDRELISEILESISVPNKLLTFSNGKEALTYLKELEGGNETQPFLILCDINMPVMNGLELRRQINESKELIERSIPFVYLTTTATKANLAEAYEMSVQGFFEKDYRVQNLTQTLQRVYDYWQHCKHPNN
ncbi:response regulator [Flavisolibacter nicotianae]|uniref:response regulator n=1 Tax=Flavisolibacter nicotianae TaxID=2364882 RepID=UPI000EB4FE1F|nr:response regulator [Flavisolibacter nicotianae]